MIRQLYKEQPDLALQDAEVIGKMKEFWEHIVKKTKKT